MRSLNTRNLCLILFNIMLDNLIDMYLTLYPNLRIIILWLVMVLPSRGARFLLWKDHCGGCMAAVRLIRRRL